MKEIIIPAEKVNEISLYCYETKSNSTKLKIDLKQNVLILLLEGEKEIYLENKINLNNEEITFINKNKCLMTEKKQNNSMYFKSLLLFYDNQIIEDFIIQNKLKIKLKNQKNEYIKFKHDHYTKNFKKSLIKISKSNLKENNNLLKNKLYELLHHLIDIYPNLIMEFISINNKNEDIQFKSNIQNNILNKLDINELAYINNMSTSTFKRKFASIYNTTPKKYIFSKRMEYAQSMLINGFKSKYICEKIGYLNLQSFNRAYNNYFGYNPIKNELFK